MKKIKAVVFDWGGVLAKNIFPDIMSYVSKVLGIEKEYLIPVFDRHHHDFMVGKISEVDFWIKLCGELGVEPPENGRSLIRDAFEKVYEPKNKVQKILFDLQKTNIMTGLLSDAEKPSVHYFYEHVHPLFDAVVFSSMVGTEKPERKIYELMVRELGVEPDEILFFDDRPENIQAAKDFGINAYQATEAEDIRQILLNNNILK